MNPNALPQSATLQDFQQFGNDISSPDYNDTLNAMQYMQSQRQPQLPAQERSGGVQRSGASPPTDRATRRTCIRFL